mmetsp:Transcript_11229/g.30235  ORF Transcript_11229/g.30235 Transcript_11229/m.30235 type:complete len:296 (-) Transcript_11229:868-1755(-)
MRRSKRPGRVNARSSTSARLVAARTITPELPSNPSISVKSWFSVCSRSSFPPDILPPDPRERPTASISSMNAMHGACFLAWRNRSRTRDAPTPTNISTNSDPDTDTNGTPASPATARASSVLPVPGGPSSKTPRGMRAPSAVKRPASRKNSTTSCSSTIAEPTPATSRNVTFVAGSSATRALLFPNSSGLMPPAPIPDSFAIRSNTVMSSATARNRKAFIGAALEPLRLARTPLLRVPTLLWLAPSRSCLTFGAAPCFFPFAEDADSCMGTILTSTLCLCSKRSKSGSFGSAESL